MGEKWRFTWKTIVICGGAFVAISTGLANLTAILDSRWFSWIFPDPPAPVADKPSAGNERASLSDASSPMNEAKALPAISDPQTNTTNPATPKNAQAASTISAPVTTEPAAAPPERIAIALPVTPRAPPIGIAKLVCETKSIQLDVQSAKVEMAANYVIEALQLMEGPHIVEIGACDASTGSFEVKPNRITGSSYRPFGPPRTGSAKAYGLSFQWIGDTAYNGTETVCSIGASDVTSTTFAGTMTCKFQYTLAKYQVNISLQ